MKTLLVAVIGVVVISLSEARNQAIAVRGKLLCGNRPMQGVRVKLWDEDTGLDPDEELDAGYTDSSGYFNLKGDTSELTNIDPVLKIYTDCDDGIKPGTRKIKFYIPDKYIASGTKINSGKTFDIGKINLEIRFKGEDRELITSRKRRHHGRPQAHGHTKPRRAVATHQQKHQRRHRRHHARHQPAVKHAQHSGSVYTTLKRMFGF